MASVSTVAKAPADDVSSHIVDSDESQWMWRLAMAVVAVAVILVVMHVMMPREGYTNFGLRDSDAGYMGITSTTMSSMYDPWKIPSAGVSRGN